MNPWKGANGVSGEFLVLEDDGIAAGCGGGRCGLCGWGLGDEFGQVAVAKKGNDGDEADGDGDEDSIPTSSR